MTRHVYELLISIAVIYGFMLFYIWQQTDRKVTQLTGELAALHVQVEQSLLSATPLSQEAPAVIGSDEFEALLVEAIATKDIQSQWWLLPTALLQYVQRENGPDTNWQNNTPYRHRRHLAQQYSIDLILQSTNAILRQAEYEYNGPEATNQSEMDQFSSGIPYMIADPLIEYILETYGYDRIPALLHGFETYEDWDDLAADVFDIPASQFEEEWHEYLRQRYPLINETLPKGTTLNKYSAK